MTLNRIQQSLKLWQNRKLPPQKLRAHQSRQLRKLIRYAYDFVPFYRKLFDHAGIDPNDFRGLEDLQYLPVIGREDIQSASVNEYLSTVVDRQSCIERWTSGSTGQPLIVLSQKSDLDIESLGWIRTWLRLGLKLTDVQASIKDLEDDFSYEGKIHWFQRLGFLRVKYFDMYDPPQELIHRLSSISPDIIRGHPSILEVLAKEIQDTPKNHQIRPRLIFTTGESLNPKTISFLENTFYALVHDCYGATEAGCVAWRCSLCDSYHLNGDMSYVEVLDNGRPVSHGETGEIVITNLFSFAMPFIRYSLNDLCRLDTSGSCLEAKGLPAIKELLGRRFDQIVLTDGRVISGEFFMPDPVKGIYKYQVIHEKDEQKRKDRITIQIVRGKNYQAELLEQIRQGLQDWLGERCEISIKFVQSIPSDHKKKFRTIISRIDSLS